MVVLGVRIFSFLFFLNLDFLNICISNIIRKSSRKCYLVERYASHFEYQKFVISQPTKAGRMRGAEGDAPAVLKDLLLHAFSTGCLFYIVKIFMGLFFFLPMSPF